MPTPVILPTYTIGAWSANVDDDSGSRWLVTQQSLASGTGIKTFQTERPFGDGAYRARSYRKGRTVNLQGICISPDRVTRETARNLLLGLFPFGEQEPMTVYDGMSTRVLTVELNDIVEVDIWPDGLGFDWKLALFAADPRLLDYTVQSASTTVVSVSTDGLDWATGGGLDWAAGSLIPNGQFAGLTGWHAEGSATLSNPTDPATSRVYAKVTSTQSSTPSGIISNTTVNGIVGGSQYVFQLDAMSATVATINTKVDWADVSGIYISTTVKTVSTTSAWVHGTATHTAPSNAASATVYVDAGPISVGGSFSIDNFDFGSASKTARGLYWGTSGTSGVLSMTNAGTATAYPVFTVTGPLTNPTFTNPATGDVIALTGTVAASQTLTIDNSPFTSTVNLDGIDRSGALSSASWIDIPPNSTTVVQFGGSGAGTLTATWQNAYI
ncbi:carbohydrate binding domain-containing protein [Amycolatopsis sp. NPDC051373]|uniref:phage distal tail protein n=1 Tax=Amycolatopsis sp. NPDC051373 TaxID=3155801 RepID=UPI00344CE813